MAGFNAAKMLGALDKKFERVYNYLIDMLCTEIKQEITIDGKHIVVIMSPKKILQVTVDGVQLFGVNSNGYVSATRFVDPSNPENYIVIGETVGSPGSDSVTFYQPFGSVGKRRLQISMFGTSGTQISGIVKVGTGDVEGTVAMSINHGDASLYLSDPTQMDTAFIALGTKRLGIDSTGFYKSTNSGSTKTYF